MSEDWSEAGKVARKVETVRVREAQTSPSSQANVMRELAQFGPRALLKVYPAGEGKLIDKGYFATSVSMVGRTPFGLAMLLGLKPHDYLKGANIYRLTRLPLTNEVESRAYSHFPDGVPLPPGKRTDPGGYGPGEGKQQWTLVRELPLEFVCSLGPNEALTEQAMRRILNLSGSAWWHTNQAKYPDSTKINALQPLFADGVQRFVNALRKAGARVDVSLTRRHPARAKLMYCCYKLARNEIAVRSIPSIDMCEIVWDHGSADRSRAAAAEMVSLFGIRSEPKLESLHALGKALDMTVTWNQPITIKDALGREVKIAGPSNGASSRPLHKVGATYGVIKQAGDASLWSVNGQ